MLHKLVGGAKKMQKSHWSYVTSLIFCVFLSISFQNRHLNATLGGANTHGQAKEGIHASLMNGDGSIR